jgi:hypothetical protein
MARRQVAAYWFRLASPAAALAAGGLALVLMVAEFPLSSLAHQNVNQGGGGAPIWLSAPPVVVGLVVAGRKPRNPLGWLFVVQDSPGCWSAQVISRALEPAHLSVWISHRD